MKRFCEFFGGEYNDAYHFKSIGLSGPKNAPYNVIVTIYKTFIQDYLLHLCQIPFQAVILDDGMSWLGMVLHIMTLMVNLGKCLIRVFGIKVIIMLGWLLLDIMMNGILV